MGIMHHIALQSKPMADHRSRRHTRSLVADDEVEVLAGLRGRGGLVEALKLIKGDLVVPVEVRLVEVHLGDVQRLIRGCPILHTTQMLPTAHRQALPRFSTAKLCNCPRHQLARSIVGLWQWTWQCRGIGLLVPWQADPVTDMLLGMKYKSPILGLSRWHKPHRHALYMLLEKPGMPGWRLMMFAMILKLAGKDEPQSFWLDAAAIIAGLANSNMW